MREGLLAQIKDDSEEMRASLQIGILEGLSRGREYTPVQVAPEYRRGTIGRNHREAFFSFLLNMQKNFPMILSNNKITDCFRSKQAETW